MCLGVWDDGVRPRRTLNRGQVREMAEEIGLVVVSVGGAHTLLGR